VVALSAQGTVAVDGFSAGPSMRADIPPITKWQGDGDRDDTVASSFCAPTLSPPV
jgi:hypothetical protein